MNEFSILIQLLSRNINKIQKGATEDELTEAMSLGGKNKFIQLQTVLNNLSKYIEPLGLQIKFNPLDFHWFISHDEDLDDLVSANPFEDKPRLAASLFSVLVLALKNLGNAKISEIKKIRKKKGIKRDLKDLEDMGYVQMFENLGYVKLTPLIGYEIDLQKLFNNVSLKLDSQKRKE